MSDPRNRIIEEFFIIAINDGANIAGLPDTVNDMVADHGVSDSDAPLGAIAICAKVGEQLTSGGNPWEFELEIATRVPLKRPDADGNSVDIPAEDEGALWGEIEDMFKNLTESDLSSYSSAAATYRDANFVRLELLGQKAKFDDTQADNFRHRKLKLPGKVIFS